MCCYGTKGSGCEIEMHGVGMLVENVWSIPLSQALSCKENYIKGVTERGRWQKESNKNPCSQSKKWV